MTYIMEGKIFFDGEQFTSVEEIVFDLETNFHAESFSTEDKNIFRITIERIQ